MKPPIEPSFSLAIEDIALLITSDRIRHILPPLRLVGAQ